MASSNIAFIFKDLFLVLWIFVLDLMELEL